MTKEEKYRHAIKVLGSIDFMALLIQIKPMLTLKNNEAVTKLGS